MSYRLGVTSYPLGAALLVVVATMLAIAPGRILGAEGECVLIEDFSTAKVGEFPADWKVRKDEGKQVYAVREENGRRFLRAQSRGLGIQAARQREWDLNAYPVLAWSWRPVEFPTGSDERESATNDSVLAVYMLVPHSKIRGPKAVKYVWSDRVPVGTRLASNTGLTQARVLRNGADTKGQWIEERVNVRDDFLTFFETTDVPRPAGIAVLTDSDDTGSSATGDYADFRACRV
ncbi:MAG: DUF3047 domain-containing protein [Candidatus Rokubacteria bacterium]|nr:DUF3047 domain-containing protein [Candidatus Rokubacteria bacterium]